MSGQNLTGIIWIVFSGISVWMKSERLTNNLTDIAIHWATLPALLKILNVSLRKRCKRRFDIILSGHQKRSCRCSCADANFVWFHHINSLLFLSICTLMFVFQIPRLLSWARFHGDVKVCCSVVVVMESCCWSTVRGWVAAENWVSLCSSLHVSLSVPAFCLPAKGKIVPDFNQILQIGDL